MDAVNRTEEIWQDFHKKLYSFISHKVSNCSDAEDLLQEVFIKILNNIEKVSDSGKIESWIYQITRNTIIDYYRSRKMTDIIPDELKPDNNHETDMEIHNDISGCISSMIKQLPEKYSTALFFSDIDRHSQKELAAKEKITLSGAKSRIQRGRRLLRNALYECCRIETASHDLLSDCSSSECSNC